MPTIFILLSHDVCHSAFQFNHRSSGRFDRDRYSRDSDRYHDRDRYDHDCGMSRRSRSLTRHDDFGLSSSRHADRSLSLSRQDNRSRSPYLHNQNDKSKKKRTKKKRSSRGDRAKIDNSKDMLNSPVKKKQSVASNAEKDSDMPTTHPRQNIQESYHLDGEESIGSKDSETDCEENVSPFPSGAELASHSKFSYKDTDDHHLFASAHSRTSRHHK